MYFFATRTNTDEKMEIADLEIDDSYTVKLSLEVSKEESVGILMTISIVTKKLIESIAGQNSEEKEETNASTT